MRIKRGVFAKKKKRALRKSVKGYLSTRRGSIKRAKEAFLKAGANAYRDRRKKKSVMRALWQIRINAAARQHGLSYSKFMHLIKKANVKLDRKILAQLAAEYPAAFKNIVNKVKVK
ncbi:MAG: 50S ribosomal protein L20 [Candidatus Moranbacteria bacterium]|nr:50S ribosomal protein L20 [Candidatus Moranbacteria bacterium]